MRLAGARAHRTATGDASRTRCENTCNSSCAITNLHMRSPVSPIRRRPKRVRSGRYIPGRRSRTEPSSFLFERQEVGFCHSGFECRSLRFLGVWDSVKSSTVFPEFGFGSKSAGTRPSIAERALALDSNAPGLLHEVRDSFLTVLFSAQPLDRLAGG